MLRPVRHGFAGVVSWCACVALTVATACTRESPPGRLLDEQGEAPLPSDLVAARGLRPIDAGLEGGFTLLAMGPLDPRPPGERIEVTLYWRVDAAPVEHEGVKAFVHVVMPGGELPLAQADHALAAGKVDLATLRTGDVVVDRFHVVVPRDFPADRARVLAGLYAGKKRFLVTRGAHDGKQRVLLEELAIPGGAPAFPTYEAKKRAGPIVVDGRLDEADWARAAVSTPFVRHDGRTKLRSSTTMRMLWDETSLYVAFEATDADVHTPYTERDDPIYESEAVEIFIDADGDRDVYVELQSAPNDVRFDAAFAGGRRKNFDTDYDVAFETKTVVDGTLNDPSDEDRGFVSEWRIPIAELKDVPSAPVVGTEWKVNLFRLDRVRKDARVVATEATAWSSPYSGDFHNLDRMGTLRFVE